MRKYHRLILASLTPIMLSACMQDYYRPDTSNIAPTDYGSPIAQADAESAAKEFLNARLKDASSAIYQCYPVTTGVERDALIFGGRVWAGYELRCGVNAKNSFGGYTGFEPFIFMFHDGALVRAYHGQGTVIQ